ncbi:MAG: cyclic nucleotide-binding domain-containing protein [Candidatus Hydrogenedentes bacterium]|nr:cyclic nucleotide-binding domain-containing protein [Candidatus Hydrogenedentota bacterium]
MFEIRKAEHSDVECVRDIFISVYGHDYPYPGFYDTEWLKKLVYDDAVLFYVGELDGEVVLTCSMNLSVGAMDDMIGEAGRLVALPDERVRGKGYALQILDKLEDLTADKAQVVFAEARTPHRGSQRIIEDLHWTAAGFEPMKYHLSGVRESVVFYVKLQGLTRELRRNNPHIIPEIAPLAQTVLANLGFPVDTVVTVEEEGYPLCTTFNIDRLDQSGISSILRIERGRVRDKEVFGGSFSLSHGIFQISNPETRYLIARDGGVVLGAIGFVHDPIDSKVRVIELIEFSDEVKGFLLSAVDRIAREELHAVYQEIDVSAYSPKIQRTLERLGFIPAAYCPSMVFGQVERLDIVRMVKLSCPYDPGPMKLLPPGARMCELVERSMEEKMVGPEITEGIRNTELFRELPDGDAQLLAKVCRIRSCHAGAALTVQGGEADHVFILLDGTARVIRNGKTINTLERGDVCGEMALLEESNRVADVVLDGDCRVIEIDIDALNRLMDSRPALGYHVTKNLARGLSKKLRRTT